MSGSSDVALWRDKIGPENSGISPVQASGKTDHKLKEVCSRKDSVPVCATGVNKFHSLMSHRGTLEANHSDLCNRTRLTFQNLRRAPMNEIC